MGLYLEAESHSQGSRVAAANVPVAILDVMLVKDVLALGLPQGLQSSSRIDVVSLDVVIPSELLLSFSTVVVTEAVSNIILRLFALNETLGIAFFPLVWLASFGILYYKTIKFHINVKESLFIITVYDNKIIGLSRCIYSLTIYVHYSLH